MKVKVGTTELCCRFLVGKNLFVSVEGGAVVQSFSDAAALEQLHQNQTER